MTAHHTYWDVSERERHSLTEEDLAQFCKVELAEVGYVYPKPPKVMSEDAPTIETTTFYEPQIDRYNRLGIAFVTMEEAAAFLKLRAVEVADDYRTDTRHSKPIVGMSIQSVELPSETQLDAVKQALAEAKGNKEANRKAREEFDKAVRTCDNLVENVREDFRNRVIHEERLQRVRDTFSEFLEIAEGDPVIATRFLLKQQDRDFAIEALGDRLDQGPQTAAEACMDADAHAEGEPS